MSERSDKTEVHEASNMLPAADAEPITEDLAEGYRQYTVNVEGQIYSVKARTVEEAGNKAQKLHKEWKRSNS